MQSATRAASREGFAVVIHLRRDGKIPLGPSLRSPVFKRGKCDAEPTRQNNIVKFNKLPAVSSSLKFAMLNPGDLVAYYFPLWKRGTKGDLQT